MRRKNSHKYDISIILVLATGRKIDRIKMSIDSLNEQDFPVDRAQVVFISNGNSKEALSLVKQWSKYPVSGTWVPNEKNTYNACFGRNTSIPYIEGKLVFFMHDAVKLRGTDYLTRLWEISENGTRGVGTKKYLLMPDGIVNSATGWYAHQDAMPASYFKRLKFDEIFDGGHGYDDLDLWQRATREGCDLPVVDTLESEKIYPKDKFNKKFSIGDPVERNINIYNMRWKK